MRKWIGASLFLAGCFLAAGCASHTLLSVRDQESLQTSHRGKPYFLKQSFFVGSFFAYEDRLYISERAFDERILIQSPSGEPMVNIEPTGVLPMGTKVTVKEIEFPTSGAMAVRKLKSPRHFTWVMLEAEGQSPGNPLVLVLTPEFGTMEQFKKALGEYLATEDPTKEFLERSEEERSAIAQKRIIRGMRADSLLRSRGYPDRIHRQFVSGVKVEQWQYASRRVVTLKEDIVESWEGFPTH
jgi:hypothetical protein